MTKEDIKIIKIVFISCFTLYIIFYISCRVILELSSGRDHYHYIDENERYEFLSLDSDVGLRDGGKGIGLAGHIEKYIQIEPYVYIIRGQDFSSGTTADGITYYRDEDPTTWEDIEYTDINDIPLYMVLNYETGEATKYTSPDEMPEDVRAAFEMPVTEECLTDRTCYDKTMVDHGVVHFVETGSGTVIGE